MAIWLFVDVCHAKLGFLCYHDQLKTAKNSSVAESQNSQTSELRPLAVKAKVVLIMRWS